MAMAGQALAPPLPTMAEQAVMGQVQPMPEEVPGPQVQPTTEQAQPIPEQVPGPQSTGPQGQDMTTSGSLCLRDAAGLGNMLSA